MPITESRQREAVRRLENEMESLQLKLTEKNYLIALFGDTEAKHTATVKKLQNELESLQVMHVEGN